MRQIASVDSGRPQGGSSFAATAVVASVIGVLSALLLCVALVAAAIGHRPLLWSHSPGTRAFVVTGLWIAAAVVGIVCGFIALVLRYPKRVWPVLAMVFGVVSLVAVPTVAVAALAIWAGPHHPSDGSMIAEFQQHQSQFDQVVAALDSTGHVDRKPLRSAGIKVTYVERSGSAILLTVSSWGIVPSGSAKGYAFSQKPLSPLTTGNTEHFGGATPDEIVFRHISGPWYIYFESW